MASSSSRPAATPVPHNMAPEAALRQRSDARDRTQDARSGGSTGNTNKTWSPWQHEYT